MNKFFLFAFFGLFVVKDLLAQPARQKIVPVSSMLIFTPQEKHTHGSTLVSLPNGDLLCAWFMGSGERTADDVKIMGARLPKGAAKWSSAFLMADKYNLPDCNPVLFLNRTGKLFLVWIAVAANKWEYSILRFKTSSNYLNLARPPGIGRIIFLSTG